MSQRKIKLLHITSSLKMGGAETILCNLIESLGNEQFEHQVIYFHEGQLLDRLRAHGVSAHKVQGWISLYDPLFFIRMFRLVKQLRPDCIHSLLWAANVAARMVGALLRVPVVSVFHNNVDQDGALRNMLDKLTAALATKLVAVSSGVANSVRNRSFWDAEREIVVIPNGVDVGATRTKGQLYRIPRAQLGLCDEDFVIGSVGRLQPVKNYGLLLESFALVVQQVPRARLVIVGVGPQEQALRAQVRLLGIEQEVVFVIGQPAYGYYPVFDCFALSSDKEGISIALLEAMSFGLPVVSTHVEKEHAVIRANYNGLLVSAGNAQELARMVCSIAVDKHLRDRLALHAQETVEEKFGLRHMVCAYKNVFADVVRLRQKKGA